MSSRSRLNAEQARGSLVRRLMPEMLCDVVFFTALRHAAHATCSKHTLPPLDSTVVGRQQNGKGSLRSRCLLAVKGAAVAN